VADDPRRVQLTAAQLAAISRCNDPKELREILSHDWVPPTSQEVPSEGNTPVTKQKRFLGTDQDGMLIINPNYRE
jgi:hypothetical protein